jgi:osmotically-inducible protein OsmY
MKISLIFSLAILLFTTSCVETVAVGTAATGVILMREKTAKDTQKDIVIASKLVVDFTKNGLKNPGNSIEITVNEGRVLLTGILRNKAKSGLAAQLAWKVEGVKEVIDEIQPSKNSYLKPKDFFKASRDYIITAEIEAKLLATAEISSLNYKITTANQVVYLIGVAQDSQELSKVLSLIAKISGVTKVVNHVILSDDSRRNQ